MHARVHALVTLSLGMGIIAAPSHLAAQTMQPTSIVTPFDVSAIRRMFRSVEVPGATRTAETTPAEWNELNAMMVTDRDTIAALVRGALANPVVFEVWARHDTTRKPPYKTPLAKAMRMVLMTLNLSDLSSELSRMTEADRRDASLTAELVRQKAVAMTSAIGFVPKASVFLEGNIKAIAAGTAAKGTAANGTMGLFVERESFSAAGAINIASTVDSVADGFSALVLSPANGKGLLAGVFDVRRRMFTAGKEFWMHGYLTGSQSTWYNFTTTPTDTATRLRAAIWGAGLLGSWDILADILKESSVALTVEGGFATRAISGDVAGEDAFRSRVGVIGDSKKFFGGIELGMKVQYKDFIGAMQVYRLDGDVKGISGLQMIGGFSARTSILSGPVGKAKP